MKLTGLEKARFNSSIKRINERLRVLKKELPKEMYDKETKVFLDNMPTTASGYLSKNDSLYDEDQLQKIKITDSSGRFSKSYYNEKLDDFEFEEENPSLQFKLKIIEEMKEKIELFLNKFYHFIQEYCPEEYEQLKKGKLSYSEWHDLMKSVEEQYKNFSEDSFNPFD